MFVIFFFYGLFFFCFLCIAAFYFLHNKKKVIKNIEILHLMWYIFRRGALIVRRLCVLLGAERVYREFSTILEGEDDLDFASIMVQVSFNQSWLFFK